MMQLCRSGTLCLLACLLWTAGSTSNAETRELGGLQKFTQCWTGRDDMVLKVEASGKLYSGLALPSKAQKCDAAKPSACKMLISCDGSTSCHRFFPGELSGREKCLVIMNPSLNQTVQYNSSVVLQSPGNWRAIIFGVAATTCGLLGVIAAGCYADIQQLVAGSQHKGRRASKAASARTSAAGAQQGVAGLGQNGRARPSCAVCVTDTLHQQ